jgi:sugar lactone lactonase YvrE
MRRLSLFLMYSSALLAQTYTISTFAGGGPPDNTPGTSIGLIPGAIAADAAGNVFFAGSHYVFKLDRSTGNVTRIAGNGADGFGGDNGPASGATFNFPTGIAVDSHGAVYVADSFNRRVRKIENGMVTTVAGTGSAGFSGDGGPATSAELSFPIGLAFDAEGSLYIADNFNHVIRKVSNGIITTVAGNGRAGFSGDNGPATGAQLNSPTGVAVDAAGVLYIADFGNGLIRRVANGIITTFQAGGTGVAVDPLGNVYIADTVNHRVQRVLNGVVTTVAGIGTSGFSGDGGPAVAAQLNNPGGVAVDPFATVYILDNGNARIRRVSNGVITTVAGSGLTGSSGDGGPAASAQLFNPVDVAVAPEGDVYVAEQGSNRIRRISNGVITAVAGDGAAGFNGDGIQATNAHLTRPRGVAVDSAGNVYIADLGNQRVRVVSNGVIHTVAGTGNSGFSGDGGPATSADLTLPADVALDADGNLYIADFGNNRIRKVSGGVITTVAGDGTNGYSGDGGPATSAQIDRPESVAIDSEGNLYFSDANKVIRKVTDGVITTVAGNSGCGFAFGASNHLVVADCMTSVRGVSNGVAELLAGNGTAGFSGDGGPAAGAQLSSPVGVAADRFGRIYLADFSNNRIRVLTPSGGAPAIASPESLVSGVAGAPYGPVQFTASGGTGSFPAWSAEGLPDGLSIDNTGVLSGTPSAGGQGNYNPRFTVTDSNNATASVTLALRIDPPAAPVPVITSVSPNPALGINSNQVLSINGSGFQNGAGLTVRLTFPSGQLDLQGAQVAFRNSSQVAVAVNFSIAAGNWTVQVINPDGPASNAFFFPVAAPGAVTKFALPHIVFGGAWYNALYFSNTTGAAANVKLDFFDDNGSPLDVPFLGIAPAHSRSVDLEPGTTAILEVPNGAGDVSQQGWAEAALPPGVIAYGVLRQVIPGRADQEAGVPFSPETSLTAEMIYDETRFSTAVAILNPSDQQVGVTVTTFGADGASVGTAELPLAPRAKLATILRDIPGLSGMSGKRGRVVFSVANGAVSVLSLRVGSEAFTSIPVAYR